jgi:hypothetical protein
MLLPEVTVSFYFLYATHEIYNISNTWRGFGNLQKLENRKLVEHTERCLIPVCESMLRMSKDIIVIFHCSKGCCFVFVSLKLFLEMYLKISN